jgi:hypothetical protein
MDIVEELIEREYQSAFIKGVDHIFLSDMVKVEGIEKFQIDNININNNRINNSYTIDDNIKCNSEYTTLVTKNILMNVYNNVKVSDTWDNVKELLSVIDNMLLPSTIPNFDKHLRNISKNKDINTTNIFIIGGGPIGLFTACYLHYVYNKRHRFKITFPKVNITIIDNKIKQEGIRLPYLRIRNFVCMSNYIGLLYTRFNCWGNYYNDSIKNLENLLYLYIYNNDIPIYFTAKCNKYSNVKQYAKKGKMDIIFDCTGGRLKHNIFSNISVGDTNNWINNLNINLENRKYKVLINEQNNYAKLVWKTKNTHRYYFDVLFLNNDKRSIYSLMNYNVISFSIMISDDTNYNIGIKNSKCMTFNNFQKLINNMKNNFEIRKIKKYLQTTYFAEYIKQIKYVKVRVIEADLQHALKISKHIQINKHNTLYIGLGDTIFRGHFIIGAGLQRVMDITTKICNLIPVLHYTDQSKTKVKHIIKRKLTNK